MGKHDKHDAVVNRSSEEFLNNRIRDLESRRSSSPASH